MLHSANKESLEVSLLSIRLKFNIRTNLTVKNDEECDRNECSEKNGKVCGESNFQRKRHGSGDRLCSGDSVLKAASGC